MIVTHWHLKVFFKCCVCCCYDGTSAAFLTVASLTLMLKVKNKPEWCLVDDSVEIIIPQEHYSSLGRQTVQRNIRLMQST